MIRASTVVQETVWRLSEGWKEELNKDEGVREDNKCNRMTISCCCLFG